MNVTNTQFEPRIKLSKQQFDSAVNNRMQDHI